MLACSLLPVLAPLLCPAPPPVDPLDEHAALLDAFDRAPIAQPADPPRGTGPPPPYDEARAEQLQPDEEPAEPDEDPAAEPGEPAGRYGVGEPWATLAECESGDWRDGGASFVEGSARWDWARPGTDLPPWGTDLHHGGLQWLPSTWEWLAPDVLDNPPAYAYNATPAEEVAVAEHYVDLEQSEGRGGYGPWPVCAERLGLPR